MCDLRSNDYYKILGIPRTADKSAIRKAYHKLSRKWHPDKTKQDKKVAEENFKKISEAYSTLSDPEKKKMYDLGGCTGNPFTGGGGGGGFPFRTSGGNGPTTFHFSTSSGGSASAFNNFDAGSLFAQMFPGQGAPMSTQQFGGLSGSPFSFSSFGGESPFGINMSSRNMGENFFEQSDFEEEQHQPSIVAGTRVTVVDLASNSIHNGAQGKILQYSPSKSRYTVALDNGVHIAAKRTNLQQLVDGVRIAGVQSRPRLNGARGRCIKFDAEKNRYTVQVEGDSIGLRKENVVFPSGTSVLVEGLQNQSQWNGHEGKIVNHDNISGRYLVQLSTQQALRLKPQNIRV